MWLFNSSRPPNVWWDLYSPHSLWVLKSLEDKLKVRYLGCFCNVTPSVSPGKRCEERVYSAHASFSITPPPALLSSPSFASLISHSVSPPLFSLEAWDKLEEWWMSCPPSRCWFIQACTLIYKQIQRADVCLCVCPFVWLCVFIVTCTFSFVVRKSVIKVALFFSCHPDFHDHQLGLESQMMGLGFSHLWLHLLNYHVLLTL